MNKLQLLMFLAIFCIAKTSIAQSLENKRFVCVSSGSNLKDTVLFEFFENKFYLKKVKSLKLRGTDFKRKFNYTIDKEKCNDYVYVYEFHSGSLNEHTLRFHYVKGTLEYHRKNKTLFLVYYKGSNSDEIGRVYRYTVQEIE